MLPLATTASRDVFVGALLGTAVGDALGLPAENLSPSRIRQRWKEEWRMRFVLGRGMISDDTEHTLLVAQAILRQPQDGAAFQRTLAWQLRWWFAGLPGGVGLATAKACLRLWLGFPPDKAAVRSAGSGPAMRSAVIGVYFANDPVKRRDFVIASSRLTHRGWPAETAALAVAECAALTVRCQGHPLAGEVLPTLANLCEEAEWQAVLSKLAAALASDLSVGEFARTLGLTQGVTGYALHVVPIAIYAWMKHPGDFRAALVAALECGGDTDTVGAIVGGLMGAQVGERGIPPGWRESLWEWPRSVSFMTRVGCRLGDQAASSIPLGPMPWFWPGVAARNLVFLVIVLVHGLRRLAPPY